MHRSTARRAIVLVVLGLVDYISRSIGHGQKNQIVYANSVKHRKSQFEVLWLSITDGYCFVSIASVTAIQICGVVVVILDPFL